MDTGKIFRAFGTGLAMLCGLSGPALAGPVAVSENGRYLVDEDGEPFFWLGDTGWELFHRLTFEEAAEYLDDRAARGFTVIHAVALAEHGGLTDPAPGGFLPLIDNDPANPDTVAGPDNDYWDRVDRIIDMANDRGLTVALLPTWGDKWNKKWGTGPEIFTPENARTYGEWLAARYGDKDIVWVLGGDRMPETPVHLEITDAMAAGIEAIAGKHALITFHPWGGSGSADNFHDREWLDFNLRQNGHVTGYEKYAATVRDYQREPVKPVIDGEPIYEDHPIDFRADLYGYSTGIDVRRPLYWDLFNGAAGHSYGNHSIWQFHGTPYSVVNNPVKEWREALAAPGADDMRHAKDLLLSRPGWQLREPDADLLAPGGNAAIFPGNGEQRIIATRAEDRSWAMVYVPVGRDITIRAGSVSGETMKAWLFDPRSGAATALGTAPVGEDFVFNSPTPGEYLDWVLVLDDTSRAYPAPGRPETP